MTTCTNALFPKQIFQKRTKAYMGIHVTNSCMYSKLVLWGLWGGLCRGLCGGLCTGPRITSSGGVGSGHRMDGQEDVHSQAANMDGVTCVFNFESPCLSNDACAFIVFNFWCLSLPFCIEWAKCVQWMRMCSYDRAKCVLASAKVFSVSANVFRVLWNRRLRWNVFIVKTTRGLIY